MPKKPRSDQRIQLRIPAEDKRAFQEAAAKMRISVSAWLVIAGMEKIEHDRERKGGR